MQELLVDFITSLDGYGAAEGWPGWWGLAGPEYLGWLSDQPDADSTVLLGANTYRLMAGLAANCRACARNPIRGLGSNILCHDAVNVTETSHTSGARVTPA